MSTLKSHQIDLIIKSFFQRYKTKYDLKIIVKFWNFGFALCLQAAAIYMVVCSALKAVWGFYFLNWFFLFFLTWFDSPALVSHCRNIFLGQAYPPALRCVLFVEELMLQSNPCRWNNCGHPDPCSPWGSTPRPQWGTWTTSSTVLHGK